MNTIFNKTATLCVAPVLAMLCIATVSAQISGGDTGGGGAAAWGSITGTIGSQTDLQTQFSTKQDVDSDLTAIGALVTTAYGRSVLTLADFAAARTLFQLVPGTNVQAYSANLMTFSTIDPSANVQSILTAPDYTTIRSLLSLTPGVNVQSYDTELAQIAGLIDPNGNRVLGWDDGTNTFVFWTPGGGLVMAGGAITVNGAAVTGITATQVGILDSANVFTGTNVEEALAEFAFVNGTGPNATNGKVDWSQIKNMPPGFVDGVDNDSGAGTGSDAAAIHNNVSGEIAAITLKGTPAAADKLLLEDSAASNAKKSATVSSLSTPLSASMSLQNLQGAVTDAQVPNTITIDLATQATTALAGDSATAFFPTGALERARGGTGADTSGYGVGLLGSDAVNASVDVDTIGELETAVGGVNIITSTEIDTMGELETLLGGVNVLTATELDSAAEFDSVLGIAGTPGAGNFLRGDWTWGTVTATPAGSDTYVQFNDGGALGADSTFTFDKTTHTLSLSAMNVTTLNATSFYILDNVNQSHGLTIVANEDLISNINLNLTLGGATRSLSITGNAVLSGTNTGDQTAGNPTASVGTAAVNGSATTFMRSDGAPALSQSITPSWTGLHVFNAGVDVKNGATSSGILRIFEDSDFGTNYTSFQVPSLAANVVYTLPPDDGTPGQYMQTDGNGVLTWQTVSGGGSLTDGDKGEVIVSGSGSVWTLDATTPPAGDNDTSVATTAFVQTAARDALGGTHSSPLTGAQSPTWNSVTEVLFYGATGTITLPTTASYAGRSIVIYNTGAFTITIDSTGSEVLVRDGTVQTGGVSMTLSSGAGNYVALVCDGVRWITLGFKGTLAVGS